MSFLAGLYYFDGRPIPERESAAIMRGTAAAAGATALQHNQAPTTLGQPGLLLAHAGSEDGCEGSAIVFDGRLDNREDLLIQFGDVLHGDRRDPALALAAYERWGADGLVQLIGDWSLAIWDASRMALVLASDFAGVRPLYYCVKPDRAVCFTSLRQLVDFTQPDTLDDVYVAGLLAFNGCPHRTPYRGVYSVPPGHTVAISKEGVETRAFWSLPIDDTVRYRRESDYEERLRALFRDAVRCRLRTSAPVLAELSGGLDSSSVVCMAKQLREYGELQDSRIVTLSHEHPGSLDTRFYTAVEEFCGFESIHVSTDVHPFLTESATGNTLPAFWEKLHSHNAGNATQLGARTYITGQLGDLVMGNWWDDSIQVAGLFRDRHIGQAVKQSLSWSKALRRPIWGILWRAMLSNLPASLVPDSVYGDDRSNGPRNREDSLTPEFRKRLSALPPLFSRTWIQAKPERRGRLRQLMDALEHRKLQPPEPLQHLAYTHPYAHRPLVEFMLSIPPEVVCGPGRPRRLMRTALRGLWPPSLRRRHSKDSFSGVFLESQRPLAQLLLNQGPRLQLVERGYVDLTSLRKRLDLLSHSLECNEPQLRHIILLELWLQGREKRCNKATA